MTCDSTLGACLAPSCAGTGSPRTPELRKGRLSIPRRQRTVCSPGLQPAKPSTDPRARQHSTRGRLKAGTTNPDHAQAVKSLLIGAQPTPTALQPVRPPLSRRRQIRASVPVPAGTACAPAPRGPDPHPAGAAPPPRSDTADSVASPWHDPEELGHRMRSCRGLAGAQLRHDLVTQGRVAGPACSLKRWLADLTANPSVRSSFGWHAEAGVAAQPECLRAARRTGGRPASFGTQG